MVLFLSKAASLIITTADTTTQRGSVAKGERNYTLFKCVCMCVRGARNS